MMVELKSSLAGKRGIRSLEVLLAMSDRYLEKLSRDVATAVTARRAVTAGG